MTTNNNGINISMMGKKTMLAVEDAYHEGLMVLGRSNSHKMGTLLPGSPEDMPFRGTFGVSADVATKAWIMMEELNFLPDRPQLCHYLWVLAFMCLYPKNDKALSRLLGNVNPKTAPKYIWQYIDSRFELNLYVVSCQMHTVLLFSNNTIINYYQFIYVLFRLHLRTGKLEKSGMIAFFLWMAQTSDLQ